MNVNKWLFVSAVFALPAFAADGVSSGTTATDGAKPAYGQHTARREACKADPEKCKAEMQARREACKADPEKCRKEREARREKWCAENPEKCREMKAQAEQRRAQCKADPEKCRQERQARADARFKKADADGNGALSRAEAEKGMPRVVRHFDDLDANKDGQLSREELDAARKKRAGSKKS